MDTTNPTKGLAGARFHVESTNGSFSKDIVTGTDGTYTLSPLDAGTYAVTETAAPNGYEIDNAGPEYVVLPNSGSSTITSIHVILYIGLSYLRTSQMTMITLSTVSAGVSQ